MAKAVQLLEEPEGMEQGEGGLTVVHAPVRRITVSFSGATLGEELEKALVKAGDIGVGNNKVVAFTQGGESGYILTIGGFEHPRGYRCTLSKNGEVGFRGEYVGYFKADALPEKVARAIAHIVP